MAAAKPATMIGRRLRGRQERRPLLAAPACPEPLPFATSDTLGEEFGQQETEVEHRKQDIDPPAGRITDRRGAS